MDDLFNDICDIINLSFKLDDPTQGDLSFVNDSIMIIYRSIINYADKVIDVLHDEFSLLNPVDTLKLYF
jgi:hypothetical protein